MSTPDEGTREGKHGRRNETHGMREDIDEDTQANDVRAPNVLERVKEEIEALSQTIHEKKRSGSKGRETHAMSKDIDETTPMSNVKAPNVFERAREEIEALAQTIHGKKDSPPEGKERHGMRNDIPESVLVNEVKAPNVFERAKEEIDVLVQMINQKKDARSKEAITTVTDGTDSSSGKGKASDLIKKAKDDIKEMMHKKLSPRHHKESHGKNDQIDTGTPSSKVKAPNMFERAKEEIDALVEAIHQKKDAKKDS